MSLGGDWLVGDSKPKKIVKVAPDGIHVTPEEIDAVIHGTARDAKAIRGGIDHAVAGLEAIKTCGLTGEALVLLVAAKVSRSKNGTRIGVETVQTVLEGLFRLGEHIR